MANIPRMGLPEPPELGAAALPSGTFDGSVVLVTGGGTGLGKGIALEFARLGAKIAIVSRSAEHLAAGVAAVGPGTFATSCDIRDATAVGTAFDEVEAA